MGVTFQFVERIIVSSDGRLTDGPAIRSATAAPAGAPDPSSIRASGISKKVGNANGTATPATTAMAKNLAAVESNVRTGIIWAMIIEASTPITITGNNRTDTRAQARRKWMKSDGRPSACKSTSQ